MILAFLPQHVWEVVAGIMAVIFLYRGSVLLTRGASASHVQGISDRGTRLIACVILILGVGIGTAAFTVHAEQPGAHRGSGWGGTAGIVIVCLWVGLMCAGLVVKLVRTRGGRQDG